eukprot:m.214108 g.214108  ORF g.214108 m.214108 type:complete len:701 (-) comp15583_c0_seq4:40-2142(-)
MLRAGLAKRMQLFDSALAAMQEARAAARGSILVSVNSSKPKEYQSHTTVAEVFAEQPELKSALAAQANNQLLDLRQPLMENVDLKPVLWRGNDDLVARKIHWHSTAHVLGAAIESILPDTLLADGPALEEGGFYYEGQFVQSINENALDELGHVMKILVKQNKPFERVVVSPTVAMEMFADNPLKQAFIASVPPGAALTVFRCGNFVDFCKGPHLASTGRVGAFKLLKINSLLVGASPRQRVHGISFPTKPELTAWQEAAAAAQQRDHRTLGKQQGLFMLHPLAPGAPFFLPHGVRVVQRLQSFLRDEYRRLGFREVITPLVYDNALWKQSGHYDHYREDMFFLDAGCCGDEYSAQAATTPNTAVSHTTSSGTPAPSPAPLPPEPTRGLKPMNCPAHCLIFASTSTSYRDLPLRLADFTALHRNEVSGALSGLTRVRQFHQDDAHIFCTEDQIHQEVSMCLALVDRMYSAFKFPYKLTLSIRPAKFVGDIATWDAAEACLQQSLTALGREWTLSPGEGAFYGPKIDITVTDALMRRHQTATLQLDFQLPRRFGLKYTGKDNHEHTPVMIHRAVLGSIERMVAVLTEHYGGKWPLWLSPRQIVVCSIGENHVTYATEVYEALHREGFHVELDTNATPLGSKIRKHQLEQCNFMVVLGDKEVSSRTLHVRSRDAASSPPLLAGPVTLSQFVETLKTLVAEHA